MIDVSNEIKEAFKTDSVHKEIIVSFPNGEHEPITNDKIISESFAFEEHTCSGKDLKFGLCEGSKVEFEAFDIEDISGCEIKVSVRLNDSALPDAEYVWRIRHYDSFMVLEKEEIITTNVPFAYREGGEELLSEGTFQSTIGYIWYELISSKDLTENKTISLGIFTVKKCISKAVGTKRHFKIEAYDKLMSEYLDEDATELIKNIYGNATNAITVYDIRRILLGKYSIAGTTNKLIQPNIKGKGMAVMSDLDIAVTLSSKYGIDTPFSYETVKSYGYTAMKYYTSIVANDCWIELDPTKAYSLAFIDDVESLEDTLYLDIVNIVMKSFTIEPYDFMYNMAQPHKATSINPSEYLGWHSFFGIGLEKANGEVEWYSKYSYKYSDGTNNVAGTLKDLASKTIVNCTKIRIHFPIHIELIPSKSSLNVSARMEFYKYQSYMYYTDAKLSDRAVGSYQFKTPSGIGIDNDYVYNNFFKLYTIEGLNEAERLVIPAEALNNVTLRNIASSIYETECQYGKLDRDTNLFSGLELNAGGLFPKDTLYPSDELYPRGALEKAFASQYSDLVVEKPLKFRNLVITYKLVYTDSEGKEVETENTYTAQINADGNTDYIMDDNWLFRNLKWSEAQVEQFATKMVSKMRDITWIPFDMNCMGMPYLECGDMIEVVSGNKAYNTYVLERNMKGIQHLTDSYYCGNVFTF